MSTTLTIPPPARLQVAVGGTILSAMGLNPFRQQRRTGADYLMVGGAVVACVLLVLWALFG